MQRGAGAQRHVGRRQVAVPLVRICRILNGVRLTTGAVVLFGGACMRHTEGMRTLVLRLLILAFLGGGAAHAGPALTLGWQDCRPAGGSGNQAFGCGSNTIEMFLHPAFELSSTVDSVFQLEMVLDIQHASDPLPQWWRLDPNQCRSDQAIADAVFTSGCTDPWSGAGVAAVQGYLAGPPGRLASQARLLVAATVPSSDPVSLSPGITYSAPRVRIRSGNSTICAGCAGSACLVLNSIQLHRLPGASPESITLTVSTGETANWVAWQGGAGANCAAVPVRNRTWGAVKSLYR